MKEAKHTSQYLKASVKIFTLHTAINIKGHAHYLALQKKQNKKIEKGTERGKFGNISRWANNFIGFDTRGAMALLQLEYFKY